MIVHEIYMPQLECKRKIRIYLPPDYNTSEKKYPVLYMQDGQNLFDASTAAFGMAWEVGRTLDQFFQQDKSKGLIVVGIDNSGSQTRYDEYSPWKSRTIGKLKNLPELEGVGGKGDKYAEFIVQTLKPFIDENYRTLPGRENTAMIGSSMGGVISLYTGLKYQNVFAMIGAMSTAAWFAEEELLDFIVQTGKKAGMKIYLDVGTNETSNPANPGFAQIYLDGSKEIYARLNQIGFTDNDVKLVIDEGAAHNENSWARRFPILLEWFSL